MVDLYENVQLCVPTAATRTSRAISTRVHRWGDERRAAMLPRSGRGRVGTIHTSRLRTWCGPRRRGTGRARVAPRGVLYIQRSRAPREWCIQYTSHPARARVPSPAVTSRGPGRVKISSTARILLVYTIVPLRGPGGGSHRSTDYNRVLAAPVSIAPLRALSAFTKEATLQLYCMCAFAACQ